MQGTWVLPARAYAGLRGATGLAALHGLRADSVVAFVVGGLLSLGGAGPAAAAVDSRAAPNHTLPMVAPFRKGLEFSAKPTPEEFFRARVFEEPLVPIGAEPSPEDNAALAAALLGYAKRGGPDDFGTLTAFLEQHPNSPWRAALLTDLGLEYYNTAHYSLALEAWRQAWAAGKDATSAKGKAIADRAAGELAFMCARLGRMGELDALLKSVEGRGFIGSAAEKITGAREGLWSMQNRPEVSFRCGPLALQSILRSLDPQAPTPKDIFDSASTQQGFSLTQVAELAKKVGLNYQMAFREGGGALVVPAVVHWKVGHYAALVRREGDLYRLQDPTFGNETWATREALDAETSGYFLIPPGPLPEGWRKVVEKEGATVWGKGQTLLNDDRCITKRDAMTSCSAGVGMAVPAIHLMTVNLNLHDEPLGYLPPVGPAVRLDVRYNHRESSQPANFTYSNFGHYWTCDWISYITDNPLNLFADVTLYAPGGGQRVFTGFYLNQQTSAPQQYDQTILKRTGAASYELLSGDGSKLVFSQPDGSIGTSRKVFLTEIQDPAGNAITLNYDSDLRIITLVDAIGQVTTLTYGLSDDIYKVTKVTDPFGRSATFDYGKATTDWTYTPHYDCPHPIIDQTPTTDLWLGAITDVIGLSSQFNYLEKINARSACAYCPTNVLSVKCVTNDIFLGFITSLITPYGTTHFEGQDLGNTRILEATYPDGSRERVEYTQANNIPPAPAANLPVGMASGNAYLQFRNTYYWSRTACALGYRDYSKARIYHWMHEDSTTTSAGLESIKEPLEGRIYFDYAGQFSPAVIGPTTRPAHIGRVLDDGSTQLYTLGYNPLGRVTNAVDPLGRTLSYLYDTNGTDLLEIRQTRGANNELLFKATYNSQHRPLTATDAAGQTTAYTYNDRGQVLTVTNPRKETTTLTYDANGYLLAVDGALTGTIDRGTIAYDGYGRVRTATSVSGDTFTLDYDNLDRITRVTFPDGTYSESTYDLLSLASYRDRAGRLTLFEHDNLGHITRITDPLGRVSLLDWCRCGALKGLTDPMGRTTSWTTDVEGRRVAKLYPDGTQVRYIYENTSSRLREVIDERQQATFYTYNRDDSLKSIAYGNAAIATPSVSFTYDSTYLRPLTMTDGTGTTRYTYLPIAVPPVLGAGNVASVDGPLENDTITYEYDELGRPAQTAVNGVPMLSAYDAAGRIVIRSNVLGSFSFSYDGGSGRLLTESFPNGLTKSFVYGDGLHGRKLQQITHVAGGAPISQFDYVRDIPARRITSWSQQTDADTPSVFSFGYDDANQLLSALVTNAGSLVNTFGYAYDSAGNRVTEQVGASTYNATYNALNQISTTTAPVPSRTNEWDAANRLTAVNRGNERTEFTYDGLSRLVGIRRLVNGSEVSYRRFVWCGGQICEERDASGGSVTKRFFAQGMKLETGSNAGVYYYTRDHLGSIREVTDGTGAVRARYSYDPFGRRTKLSGDVDTDFGFAGMLFSPEALLALTHFRAYDPELGRWLSRDPLGNAELRQGPNVYAYVGNGPVNQTDPSGLLSADTKYDIARYGALGAMEITAFTTVLPALDTVSATCFKTPVLCAEIGLTAAVTGGAAFAAARGAAPADLVAVECETSPAALQQEIAANPRPETLSTEILPEDIPDLPSLPDRVQTLATKVAAMDPVDFELVREANLQTPELYDVETEFYEVGFDMAAEEGITPEEAWAKLADMVKTNPRLWPQIRPIQNLSYIDPKDPEYRK